MEAIFFAIYHKRNKDMKHMTGQTRALNIAFFFFFSFFQPLSKDNWNQYQLAQSTFDFDFYVQLQRLFHSFINQTIVY